MPVCSMWGTTSRKLAEIEDLVERGPDWDPTKIPPHTFTERVRLAIR